MPDEPCWRCGAEPQVYLIECPECLSRWEDAECRELRERLFAAPAPELLSD